MTTCDTSTVVGWLVDGARSAPQQHQILLELCDRLIECGVPLWRVGVFVRTLHPHVMGRRFLWQPDIGVSVTEAEFARVDEEDYQTSPVVYLYGTGRALRRRLRMPIVQTTFPSLTYCAA